MSQQQDPRQTMPHDKPDAVAGGQVSGRNYIHVAAGNCCKFYEPNCGGRDDLTCGACKYSSGLCETLICEHPANML